MRNITFGLALLLSCWAGTVQASSVTVFTKVTGNGQVQPELAELRAGDSHTLYVSPDNGYAIQSISGCNGSYEDGVYLIEKLTANCMVSVAFTEAIEGVDPRTLNQQEQRRLSGSSTTGAATLSSVSSSAVSSSAAAAAVSRRSGSLLLLLAADFVTNTFEVTAQVLTAGGTITPAQQQVRVGESASFTVTVANGFMVASIQGCGINSTQPGTIVSPVLSAACSVSAVFQAVATAVWDSFAWDNAVWG